MSIQNIRKKETAPTTEAVGEHNKITTINYSTQNINSQDIWENPLLIERIKKLPVGSFFRLAGQLYCRQTIAYACDWQLFAYTTTRFKLGKDGEMIRNQQGEKIVRLCTTNDLYKNNGLITQYTPSKNIVCVMCEEDFLNGADLLGVPVDEN